MKPAARGDGDEGGRLKPAARGDGKGDEGGKWNLAETASGGGKSKLDEGNGRGMIPFLVRSALPKQQKISKYK